MDSSNSNSVADSGMIIDRLSELPDSLIVEILSLLPYMAEVVPTMILSKRWLHLWATLPSVDFNICSKYPDFVSGALAHWKGSKIHKFSLVCHLDSVCDSAMIDSWLLFAVEKQVEDLNLYTIHGHRYFLPQHLYSCSSITNMFLSYCNLRIDEAVQWNGLRCLTLRRSNGLTQDAMNRILEGSPLLEELILNYSCFSENLNIRSTSLKILSFRCNEALVKAVAVLRIWAPNLLDLKIYGFFYGISLLDVPSLTNANICFRESSYAHSCVGMFNQFFQSICRVEKLTLSDFAIKALLSMKQNGFLVEFSNAKSLSLYIVCVGEMLGVVDMFPNLTLLWVEIDKYVCRRLIAQCCEGDDVHVRGSDLSKAALPSPSVLHLKRVEISWFAHDVSIIPAIEILLQNAHSLDKMVFRPEYDPELWEVVEEKVLSLPRSSPTAEVIVNKNSSSKSSRGGYYFDKCFFG